MRMAIEAVMAVYAVLVFVTAGALVTTVSTLAWALLVVPASFCLGYIAAGFLFRGRR